MPPRSFRVVSLIVSALLLAALIFVVVLTFRNQPATALPPTTIPSPTTSVAATATLAEEPPTPSPTRELLGEERTIEAGGFAFKPVMDYSLDFDERAVTLTAGQDAAAAGAVFLLTAGAATDMVTGTVEGLDDAFPLFVDFFAARSGLSPGQVLAATVGGNPALAVDLAGPAAEASDGSTPSPGSMSNAGRVVMAQPDPEHLFIMVGQGPVDAWQEQGSADFDAILATVRFLEPVATATPTATATVATAATERPSVRATLFSFTATVPISPTATITATAATTVTPAPSPTPLSTPTGRWRIYSNGNYVNGLAIMKSTVWSASSGGVLAWNKSTNSYVKFTTLDGLATNFMTSAENCPLTGLGVLFGSNRGIQVFDTQNGSWKTLDSEGGQLSFDDVVALHCRADDGYLALAYLEHGMEIYDAEAGVWSYIGEAEGLVTGRIRDFVTTGDREAIWIASNIGLSLYRDGETTVFTSENSPLTGDQITAIGGDGGAVVWLAAAGDLFRTDGEEWQLYNRDSVTNGQWPNGSITGLAVADDGSIWIGSDQAQICQFDPAAGQCVNFFTNAEGMAIAPLTSLRMGEDDEVFYTTAGAGISMYSGGRWKQMVVADEIVPGNQIRSLAADENGLIWIGANGGAAQVDPDTDQRKAVFSPANSPLPSADVRTVYPIGATSVWFGAGGASYYDGTNWTNYTVADGLAGPDVQAITADGQNRTWLGTRTGLSIWTGATFFNLTSENGLPSDDITALLADGAIVWIGTRNGLLRFQDNQLQVFNTENIGLPSNDITALSFDAEGAVLVGTEAGLARLGVGQAELVEGIPAAPITALTTSAEGETWVATDVGELYHFDGSVWSQMTDTARLPSSQITALLVDDAGDLWIGCALGGLARITFTP